MNNLKRWDKYFYNVCKVVKDNSVCLSRHIGSVLVKDKSIISTGYNGPPRGVRTCDTRWLVDKKMREAAGFETKFSEYINQTQMERKYEESLKGICPRYIPEMGFKSGEGLEWCVAAHSEANALINAARNGIKTKDTKLYMTCSIPCSKCLSLIINSGVEEIIVTGITFYDESAEYLMKESGLKYRIFEHLKDN